MNGAAQSGCRRRRRCWRAEAGVCGFGRVPMWNPGSLAGDVEEGELAG